MQNLLIIQARTGSSRLPNKVLKNICGKPMLRHVIERTCKSKLVDQVVVATTSNYADDGIKKLCDENGIDCYRGSENDVLDRYYQTAKRYNPQNVIRITADCPFIDPVLMDKIILMHENGGYDYTSNTLKETYPDGLDTEIMKFSALEEAWKNAELLSEREHVTPYIKFKGNFRRFSVEQVPSLAEKRWTVDTVQDYEFVCKVYHALYKENKIFLMDDILNFLDQNKQLELLNANIVRNEGYLKSISNDYVIQRGECDE